MSNKTHVTFGTCQKVASLEALIKWQQSLCSDVCAVVHGRFTPCLLQNKVVSCSMRLNLFCLDTRLHNTDNEPFTCQLLIKIMQILTNVSTKGGSCNPCFQWGLGLGWSRRHPREMDSPFQVASGLTSVFAIPCHMATTCRDK